MLTKDNNSGTRPMPSGTTRKEIRLLPAMGMSAEMETLGTIIIGGGIGGLSAGALLAEEGDPPLLLEAHSAVGGCAVFFDRYEKNSGSAPSRFRFDVGATC
jgi:heterodisulfide reductase subunit A-like polyferredoxin